MKEIRSEIDRLGRVIRNLIHRRDNLIRYYNQSIEELQPPRKPKFYLQRLKPTKRNKNRVRLYYE